MKKLFVCCPMRGRNEEDIFDFFSWAKSIAEAYCGETLELIDTYIG